MSTLPGMKIAQLRAIIIPAISNCSRARGRWRASNATQVSALSNNNTYNNSYNSSYDFNLSIFSRLASKRKFLGKINSIRFTSKGSERERGRGRGGQGKGQRQLKVERNLCHVFLYKILIKSTRRTHG